MGCLALSWDEDKPWIVIAFQWVDWEIPSHQMYNEMGPSCYLQTSVICISLKFFFLFSSFFFASTSFFETFMVFIRPHSSFLTCSISSDFLTHFSFFSRSPLLISTNEESTTSLSFFLAMNSTDSYFHSVIEPDEFPIRIRDLIIRQFRLLCSRKA